MSPQAVFVLLTLIAMIIILAKDIMRPGLVLFSAVVLLMVAGTITPSEVVAGFSNKGMITVAILFLVSEGVRQSGALDTLISKILPMKKSSIPLSLTRMLPSVAAISAFLNNTAVVIIFAPIIKKWSETMNLPSTKFLIPLSYATILGGVCTLIGTSTNLVVHGMMLENGYDGFSMFELGKVGVAVAVVGIIYIIVFGNLLLPGDRIIVRKNTEVFKEYYFDVIVSENGRFGGCKINGTSLEQLPQMEIRSVKRGTETFDPLKNRDITLQSGDQILFAGKSSCLQTLLTIDGLTLSCLTNTDKSFVKRATKQVEAVLGPRFPGINKSLGNFDFYRHYGAVVMSVHRNGERITVDMDSLVLQEGDNLVLLADNSFMPTWGESRVFYLVNERDDFLTPQGKKTRWFALGLVAFMIVGATLGDNIDELVLQFTGNNLAYWLPAMKDVRLDMFYFAAIVMVIMAWTKLFPSRKYTKYISWDILIAIASAFAISKAMINSGIATVIARTLIDLSSGWGPLAVLAAMYIITNICTEIVTNNAAAALTFPIALAVSEQMGVNPYPFFVAICIAASASFSTPIGYQTNLIVQSIGNYKFKDYLRIGLPLNLITFIISILLIPIFWKF